MGHGASSYRRFLSGEKEAFEEIVRTYSDSLVFFSYAIVGDRAAAEDVMMDTFVSLIVKKRQFREERAFKAYLFKTARNKSVDYLRSRKRQISLDSIETLAVQDSLESAVIKSERDKRLYECMLLLPSDYRDALYLVYIEDFSVEETCKVFGKSRKQVYNLLCRAKASLRTLMSKEDLDYGQI